MLRRSFFLKLSSLLGTTFAASALPNNLVNLDSSSNDNTIVYEMRGEFVKDVDKIYNISNLNTLKKAYKEAGKLISVSKTKHETLNKVVMTFNSAASRKEFITEYYGNLSRYKKLS